MAAETGAGSLNRAVVVLKALASAGEGGLALTLLSKRCGLPNSSVHRVLRQLCTAQLAYQASPEGPYALGPLAFELGIAAAQQFDVRGRSRPAVTDLANEVGDSAYLFLRSGHEAVCLDRVFGPAPVRVVTLRVGSRRPLGLGAGGLAILAALDESEREGVIKAVAPTLAAENGVDEFKLRTLIDRAREQGFVYLEEGITAGVSAVGRPILNSFRQPIGGLSIAAPPGRLPVGRVEDVASALERATRRIEVSLFAADVGSQF